MPIAGIDRMLLVFIQVLLALASCAARAEESLPGWRLKNAEAAPQNEIDWVASDGVLVRIDSRPVSDDAPMYAGSDATAVHPIRLRTEFLKATVRHSTLSIDGDDYVLDVYDSQQDPRLEYRHVSAAVINDSPVSYARFTFPDPTNDDVGGALVGTLNLRSGVYRILQEESGHQYVYRLDADQDNSRSKYRSLATGLDPDSDLARLERRHVQAEFAATVRPDRFWADPDLPLVQIIGGSLPKISAEDLEDKLQFRERLSETYPVTKLHSDIEVVVDCVEVRLGSREDEGSLIRIEQYIDGLRYIDAGELHIASDGRVVRLTMDFLTEKLVDNRGAIRLSESEALGLAMEWLREANDVVEVVLVSEGERVYRAQGSARLQPRQTFAVTFQDRGRATHSFLVAVDLETGEVTGGSSRFSLA
mgnify:CR=1 FL=1